MTSENKLLLESILWLILFSLICALTLKIYKCFPFGDVIVDMLFTSQNPLSPISFQSDFHYLVNYILALKLKCLLESSKSGPGSSNISHTPIFSFWPRDRQWQHSRYWDANSDWQGVWGKLLLHCSGRTSGRYSLSFTFAVNKYPSIFSCNC